MYCFDTDILSAVLRRDPPLRLIRRLAVTPPSQQFTTSITYGEMIYGAAKRGSTALADRIRALLHHAVTVLPFDDAAAERYGHLRAGLEADGMPLAEPDLRIAAIALSRSLTLVTANTRHFDRITGLTLENWLAPGRDRPGHRGRRQVQLTPVDLGSSYTSILRTSSVVWCRETRVV